MPALLQVGKEDHPSATQKYHEKKKRSKISQQPGATPTKGMRMRLGEARGPRHTLLIWRAYSLICLCLKTRARCPKGKASLQGVPGNCTHCLLPTLEYFCLPPICRQRGQEPPGRWFREVCLALAGRPAENRGRGLSTIFFFALLLIV